MYVEGMYGLGDNIYQRAIVRALPGPVYLKTPWPQLYADLPNVLPVQPMTRLRTQRKNAARAWRWHTVPAHLGLRRAHYVHHPGTMLEGLAAAYGVQLDTVTFDLPAFPSRAELTHPYMLVRPATVRSEWRADGRNPRPEYLQQATQAARDAGFVTVSVADLAAGEEWCDGTPPHADLQFHHGELTVEQLLGLVRGAAGVIGGVGWLLPAAIAYQVPMLLLYGGWGGANGPQRILDSRLNVRRIRQVFPDRFCLCRDPFHDCDKTITTLEAQIADFLDTCPRG